MLQEEALSYGIDWDLSMQKLSGDNEQDEVLVNNIECPLTTEQINLLKDYIDPCRESSSFGSDIYIQALELIRNSQNYDF